MGLFPNWLTPKYSKKEKNKIKKEHTILEKEESRLNRESSSKKAKLDWTIYTETSSQAPCRQSVKNKIAWFKPIDSNPILLEYVQLEWN